MCVNLHIVACVRMFEVFFLDFSEVMLQAFFIRAATKLLPRIAPMVSPMVLYGVTLRLTRRH
jgi:hypothetical protein